MDKPIKTHDYSGHHLLDPKRWDHYMPRNDDIVVSTSQKAGTTWVQTIVANLIFQDGNIPGPIGDISPWLESRFRPLEITMKTLESQTHRRSIKTHLPLNGMNYYEQVKYIVVGRDARDVFMSLLNHHRSLSDEILNIVSGFDDLIGKHFPPDVGDDKSFWRKWISQSWFEWESDGYPYWSHLNHIQSWWQFRKLPNVLMVHFNDLLSDPEAEICRIGDFIGIPVDRDQASIIRQRTSFSEMKKNFDRVLPEMKLVMREGVKNFMHKGTNGRWRNFMDEEDLDLYYSAIEQNLTADCACWLEHGYKAGNLDH